MVRLMIITVGLGLMTGMRMGSTFFLGFLLIVLVFSCDYCRFVDFLCFFMCF